MGTTLDEGKPNGRYGVRSRDCHATDAHRAMSIWGALQWNLGASNLLAQEDLELF